MFSSIAKFAIQIYNKHVFEPVCVCFEIAFMGHWVKNSYQKRAVGYNM